MPDNDKIIKLRDTLIKEGYTPPPIDRFAEDMKDSVKLRKVRETLIKEGYTPPDFNTMYSDINPVEKQEEIKNSGSFSMPMDIGKFKENKSGFSVPAEKQFSSIPQNIGGYEAKSPMEKARQIARKDFGESTGASISRTMSYLTNPIKLVTRKIGQGLGVLPDSKKEDEATIAEFQSNVKWLDDKQREDLKKEIEGYDINDTAKQALLHTLRADVTPVLTQENIDNPQDSFTENVAGGFKESTKDYALATKIMMDAKRGVINKEDVDPFIDDMYSKYVGINVASKNEKDVAREALGISQDFSGALGRAVGYTPVFMGELAVITAATGGEGAIPRAFEGAKTSMKIVGGLIDQSVKMGLQQSIFEGRDFETGAKLGASYYAGGLVTGSIFGLNFAKALMVKGMSARMAGKTVAALQAGAGATLGGSAYRFTENGQVDANTATIDLMMGSTFGLFHKGTELRKQAVDHIIDKAVESGVVDPVDAPEMKQKVIDITSDAQNFKAIAKATLETIDKSKGKDFTKVIEEPIDIKSDFPLKNISDVVDKTTVEQKTTEQTTTEKEVKNEEKEAQKEKEVLGGNAKETIGGESDQGKKTGVPSTDQTPAIEIKPSEVFRIKPQDINIDESRFQNRTKLNEDVLKQMTDKYSDQEMDALKVWRDPNDGKYYLLSGHHRREAAIRTSAETVKVEEFKGTEQEAVDYAKQRSNANRSMESELDRAKIYRQMRESNMANTEIMAKAEIEGKNKSRVLAFSYLNPDGKTSDALKTIPSSSDQYNTVRQIAQWIGETRKMYPELTNSHENEIFDYLVKGGQSIFGNKLNFQDRVGSLVDKLDFDKEKPLNIANRVSKTDVEMEFDQRLAEAQSAFDKSVKDLNEFRKRAIAENVSGDALEKALKPYNDAVIIAQRELSDIKNQKGSVKDAARTQTDIFSQLTDMEQQLKEGSINEQQAGDIVSNIESKIDKRKGKNADAASVIRSLEARSESVSDRETARKFREEVDRAIKDNFKTEDAIDVGSAIKGDEALISEVKDILESFKKEFDSNQSSINAYKVQLAREIYEVATESGAWKRATGGSESADSKYVFDDIPVETNPRLQIEIMPMETMEALEMLRNNGLVPTVKQITGKSLGSFHHTVGIGNGKIKLAKELFLPGRENDLVRTMFHEIGHWVDWMPEKDLRRGSLGNRLHSLYKMKDEVFDFKNKEYMTELKKLSKEWRPWNEEQADKKEKRYRNNSRELYADFISALFNNPGYTKRVAPKSFDTFFKYLDRKPTIKENYFETQKMYNGGHESVVKHRDQSVNSMFDQRDYKASELQQLREAEMERLSKSWTFSIAAEIIDMNKPVESMVRKAQKSNEKAGSVREELKDILPFVRDMNYIDRLQEATVRKVETIHDDVVKADMDWRDVGKIMLYERITKGDRYQMLSPDEYAALTGEKTLNDIRVDLHNPLGLNRDTAQELLDFLKGKHGEKYAVLEKSVKDIRDLFQKELDFAHDSGLISTEKYEDFKRNPYYATFQVTEYMDSDITHKFYNQLGTFKEIQNPADAMLLKMLVMRAASIKNRARKAVIDLQKEYFPEDIVEGKKNPQTGALEPVNKERARYMKELYYMDKGEGVGAYVEPYIHDILMLNKPLAGNALQKTFRIPNAISKNLMLTYSLGWQLSNHFIMDPFRSWVNTPSWNLVEFTRNRLKSYGPSAAYAFNLKGSKHYAESIRLLENEVLGEGYKDLTYESLHHGETPADRHLHELLYNSGIGSFKAGKIKGNSKYFKPVADAMSFIEQLTLFLDNVAKTQGFYDLSNKNLRPGEVRDFVHRNIGTPAFRETGKMANVMNPLLLFASSNLAALSADMKLATDPKTKTGWWSKVTTSVFMPKLLTAAAAYGWYYMTDDQKKNIPQAKELADLFRDIPEYDKTNYTCIPLGKTKNNRTAYLRIPFDQTSRLMGAIFYKSITAKHNEETTGKILADIMAEAYGGLPSVNPWIKGLADGVQFLGTGNAYNYYTGQMVLPNQVQKAGGWRARKMFLSYMFEQVGGSVFYKPYTNEMVTGKTINPTPGERIIGLPVIGSLASRFYRESNRGTSEFLRNITQNMDARQAENVLATDDAITRFVKSGKMDGQELIKALKEENVDLSDPLEAGRIQLKLKAALIRGESDPFMNALIDAGVEKRVAILTEAKKLMDDKEFLSYLNTAKAFGLIPK